MDIKAVVKRKVMIKIDKKHPMVCLNSCPFHYPRYDDIEDREYEESGSDCALFLKRLKVYFAHNYNFEVETPSSGDKRCAKCVKTFGIPKKTNQRRNNNVL